MCYVNETSITGGLDNTLKNPEESNILTAGTIITGNDWIVMKVSFAGKFSFLPEQKNTQKY